MTNERFPFAEAIKDKNLLKPRWETLSKPQQVALAAFYGLPLSEEEQLVWAILQGSCEYDELGYPTKVYPLEYIPKEYDTFCGIVGRRSGKTDVFAGTIALYEILLGGHTAEAKQGQELAVFFVAQDVDAASRNMPFIYLAAKTSPILFKEVAGEPTASHLKFKNKITVYPEPCNITSSRGYAIPVVIMDEVGFWYTDPKAANPDIEVQRALMYAQSQFTFKKQVIISTPWTKEGLLWEYNQAGTEGRRLLCQHCKDKELLFCNHPSEEKGKYDGVLVINAPTAAMANPEINRQKLISLYKRDPVAYPRESLAQFQDSISGFLSRGLLELARDVGVVQRQAEKRHFYVAAIDPAFRNDDFAFTIFHHDPEKGIVQDYFKKWTPPSTKDRLNPAIVLDEIGEVLRYYGISNVFSDQYQLESLQQIALARGFNIQGVDFTAASKTKILGNLEQLVNLKRIRLLDNNDVLNQLAQLEKRKTAGGVMQISAPQGKHDDAAMVTALAAFQAVWLLSSPEQVEQKPKTHAQQGMEQIQRKQRELASMEDDW